MTFRPGAMRPAVDSLVTFQCTLSPDPPVPPLLRVRGGPGLTATIRSQQPHGLERFARRGAPHFFGGLAMPGQTSDTQSQAVSRTGALLMAVLSAGVLMVVGRTVRLQYYPQRRLSAMAFRQHDRLIKKRAYRGSIFDRNKRVLVSSVNAAIRGMQFGDINGQHIQYTQDMIKFILEQLATLDAKNIERFVSALNEYQKGLAAKGKNDHNPVSATSMDAGEVELF